jgi:hypothetical protein
MPRDELERTVRRLVDKDEISDLVRSYSHCIDRKLYDDLAALFVENCVIDFGPGVGPAVHGRTAFRATLGRPGGGFAATSHHNASVLITFENEDQASVRSSVYAWHLRHDGHTALIWGCYDDVVERTSEGWRFALRRLRVAGHENYDLDWLPLIDNARRTG